MKKVIVGLVISVFLGVAAMAGPFFGFDHYLPGNVSVLYGGFSIEGLKLSVTVGDILGLGGANAFIPIGWESVFIPDVGFGADWVYEALVADVSLDVDVALVTPNPVYVGKFDAVGMVKFHVLPPLGMGDGDWGL